ncbi:MAG: tetratricopeptide repeat protein [Acidobacteria bacterium]|nr:tetratricopeptide repeat protein [Acidobacteriota bacterium]
MLNARRAAVVAALGMVCLVRAQEQPGPAAAPHASFELRMVQANRLRMAGKLAEAETIYRQLAAESESFHSTDVRRPKALNNLAALHHTAGRLDEAEKLYLQALPLFTGLTGEDSADTSSCLNNLGEVQRLRGDLESAEEYFKRALEARESRLKRSAQEVALTLNSHGAVQLARGDLAGAESSHTRARDLQERHGVESTLPLSASLNNLAEVYRLTGRVAEAEGLFRRALELRESDLGPEHPETAVVLNNLGVLMRDKKDWFEAEKLLSRAAAIWYKAAPNGHPMMIAALINYGEVLSESGLNLRSETVLLRALEMCGQYMAPTHEYVARLKNDLGALHLRQGKGGTAEQWFQEALAAAQPGAGSKREAVVTAERGIVAAVQLQGRPEEASALLEKFGLALQ